MAIPLAGLQKVSLIDYPGHICAIAFLQGCNMRCPYCHNAVLVPCEYEAQEVYQQRQETLLAYLAKNKGLIEGLCITGGEPTLFNELPSFIEAVKDLGFKVKLDTNGTNPEQFKKLLDKRLLDYIAMDIKTSLSNYDRVGITSELLIERIKQSIELIKTSDLEYEFRTTLEPNTVKKEDIELMGQDIKGAKKWIFQAYRPDIVLKREDVSSYSYSPQEAEDMLEIARQFVEFASLRGYAVAVH